MVKAYSELAGIAPQQCVYVDQAGVEDTLSYPYGNASFHRKSRLAEILARVGCTLLPLPPLFA